MTGRTPLLRPAALALALAFLAVTLGLAACAGSQEGHNPGAGERGATVERQRAGTDHLQRERGAGLPVRIEVAGGVRLERRGEAELVGAARRFARTLAGWLYGRRREMDVEPVVPELRRELARAPPYVPDDQIGSGGGDAVAVQVFLQTPGSGVLTVVIADSRTRYPIPASFERRAGRWLIVHLNAH